VNIGVATEPARLGQEGGREQKPVTEHRQEECVDVVGQDVASSMQERPGAGSALERKAATHGRADHDALDGARRPDELDRPVQDQIVDVDVLDLVLQRAHLVGRDERLEGGERVQWGAKTIPSGGFHSLPTRLHAPGLLLCGELAAWSVDERLRISAERAVRRARAVALGALAFGSLALAALVVALAAAPAGSGLAWTVLGAAGTVAVVGLAVRLARRG